jgi:hypothetical protein
MGIRVPFEIAIPVPVEFFLVNRSGADDRSRGPSFRGGNFRSEEAGREVLPIGPRESVVRMERRAGRSIEGRPRAEDRSRGEEVRSRGAEDRSRGEENRSRGVEDRVPAGRSDFFTTRERGPFNGLSFEPRSLIVDDAGRSSEDFARGPFARTGRIGRADDFRIGRIVEDAFFGPLRGGVGIR